MGKNLDYNKIIHSKLNSKVIIDYGIINGDKTIVFIKAGQDGSMYGYKNKYLEMALYINKNYGYTVICSSNPFEGTNPLDNATEIIENYCNEQNFEEYTIYYMGHSNGALIGAWFGFNYTKIKRMLLINGPLIYNWHKTRKGIEKFSGEKVVFVYGSLDPSFKYTELIKTIKNKKAELFIIEGQDHHFSKDTFDFKKLPEKFLLN